MVSLPTLKGEISKLPIVLTLFDVNLMWKTMPYHSVNKMKAVFISIKRTLGQLWSITVDFNKTSMLTYIIVVKCYLICRIYS